MDNASQPDCNQSLSADERRVLVAILSSGGLAGMLSCSVGLALLVFFKMYKQLSERLSLYLLLSGLFMATVIGSTIVGVRLDFAHHHRLCQAIGFFVQYSIWTLLLLTTFVSFHLSSLVFFYKMFNKLEPFYILFTLVFPLLFSWIPFIHNTYGLAGAWCWIRAFDHEDCSFYIEGLIEQYVLWYGPLFVVLIGNFASTVAVSVVLCYRAFRKPPIQRAAAKRVVESGKAEKRKTVTFEESMNDAHNEEARLYKKALKKTLPLLVYPIIFNIFSWFALANRIRRVISPGSSYASWVIHAIAAPTWAFFVGVMFIIYVIARKKLTKQNIKKAAHSWKHSFTRMKRPYMQFQVPIGAPAGTDALTTEGYTVTNPTTWEPKHESDFDDVNYSSYDDNAQ